MIKKTYIVAFVVVLLVVFSTSLVTYEKNKQGQIQETMSILRDMSSTSSAQYDSVFFEIKQTVKRSVANLDLENFSTDKIEKDLKKICTDSYYIEELVTVSSSGVVVSTLDDLNLDFEKFESMKLTNCTDNCLGLIQSSLKPYVFFCVHKCESVDGKVFYVLVGINYNNINQIVKPDNYNSFDSSVYFISNDGYILYHPNKLLINKNLVDDKDFIMKYFDLSVSSYNKLIKNTINLSKSNDTYFKYEALNIQKIGLTSELANFDGSIVIATDFKAISSKYLILTFKILIPIFICFFIACYIFARYIYMITYTDYFTEMKNQLAFEKYLKRVSKSSFNCGKYFILKIDHIIDANDKDFIFDDSVFYDFAKKLKHIRHLYADVYRISRLCYVFVLDDFVDKDHVMDLVLELKYKIENNAKKLYIRGRILALVAEDVDVLRNNENIDGKISKYMDDFPCLLSETKKIDVINYEDIIDYFDLSIKNRSYVENLIENKLIVPFYQPIVDIKTGNIIKHEVLMRVNSSDNKLNTADIIIIAEEENLVDQIDCSMIKQSFFMYAKRFKETSKKTNLSINLSCKSVHKSMVDFILKMIQSYDVDPRYITFELTETATIDNLDKTIYYLNLLRKYGFLIAIDDFGTGYAHVELLAKLNVDYVKIDGIFIRDIENDSKKLKTLNALVYLAKIYEVEIIAEFVENIEVVQILQKLNIEYAQGYYFGKPESSVLD